ncbi:MAG: hypothetical protein ACOYK8_03970 [Alphaproteobacteria bacterium]
MTNIIKEVHEKAQHFLEKHGDQELYDYMLTLAANLEHAEMLKHHFGYFVMHAQAVIPYDIRPRHFREALERAKKVLEQGN